MKKIESIEEPRTVSKLSFRQSSSNEEYMFY